MAPLATALGSGPPGREVFEGACPGAVRTPAWPSVLLGTKLCHIHQKAHLLHPEFTSWKDRFQLFYHPPHPPLHLAALNLKHEGPAPEISLGVKQPCFSQERTSGALVSKEFCKVTRWSKSFMQMILKIEE